jgi:hypothetical protein
MTLARSYRMRHRTDNLSGMRKSFAATCNYAAPSPSVHLCPTLCCSGDLETLRNFQSANRPNVRHVTATTTEGSTV